MLFINLVKIVIVITFKFCLKTQQTTHPTGGFFRSQSDFVARVLILSPKSAMGYREDGWIVNSGTAKMCSLLFFQKLIWH